MTISKSALALIITMGALCTSSCALIPVYVSDPNVEIELLSTRTGRIVSAGFWEDRYGVSLRGEFTLTPISRSPLAGHIDIAITAPDGLSTECRKARNRNRPRRVRKPYSFRFEALPAPGSVVRMWHHAGATHGYCIA